MRKSIILIAVFCLALAFGLCSCELDLNQPAFTKINVLVYGNDYNEAYYNGQKIPKLRGTINDATQVGLALEALAAKANLECDITYVTGKNYKVKGQYSEAIAYVPESKSDHDTTKAHFRSLMKDLANDCTNSELTIIYFSCHGLNERIFPSKDQYGEKSETSFAMCANSSVAKECEFYTHEEFKADLAQIKGAKVVFADVCYSGGLVESSHVAVNPNEYENIDATSLFWNYKVNQDPNTFILTACRYYEQSYETSDHGQFTTVLLDALGWNEEAQAITTPAALCSDGHTLTFFGVCQYVVKNNKSSTTCTQNPMLSNASNDIILFTI